MSFLLNWFGNKKERESEEKEKKKQEGETEEKLLNDGENSTSHKKVSSLNGIEYDLGGEEKPKNEEEKKEIIENEEKKEREKIITNNILELKLESKENNDNSVSVGINENKNEKDIIKDLTIDKQDPLHWKSMVYGPENTPYENGKFEVMINFEEDKPDQKPKIQFLTKIYHYNISQNNGEILCPYIWNLESTEEENLKNIKLLMEAPDSRYPCSKFIQDEYYNDFPKYKEKASNFTEEYAINLN